MRRKIVQIDESKCNGCGLCVPSCAEGAIEIVDGKARLAADIYCDGLGACLGECPQDAITVIEREAQAFDEEATEQHLEHLAQQRQAADKADTPTSGCPGAMAQSLPIHQPQAAAAPQDAGSEASQLSHWPVQLHLVPPTAPFLKQADLLLVADCVPFAFSDFHGQFLRGRPVVIGCPKLDDPHAYVEKLAQMVTASKINSITVIHMEVPCCTGLVRIAESALQMVGSKIPLEDVTISIRGQRI